MNGKSNHTKKNKNTPIDAMPYMATFSYAISDAMPYMATCSYGMSDVMPSLASSWMSSLTIKRK